MWQWAKVLKKHLSEYFVGPVQHEEHGYYYVYELLDPRFEPPRVFYVGKGQENRLYDHEAETRTALKKSTPYALMKMSCKHKRILEIWDDGKQVEYAIAFRTNSERDAYRMETRIIKQVGIEKLTNDVYGMPDASIDSLLRKQEVRRLRRR